MGNSRYKMTSSYTIFQDTDTFVLIKDNNDPDFASVTNAADYTVESLAENFDLYNRRIIYQDTMGRFDELCHRNGQFAGFRPLTACQQRFFEQLLAVTHD